MNHGIKLIQLSVQDVGVLGGRIDVGPFAGGINVISGRNEAGKSTLVEALRAALFERYDARNKNIKALQTHGTRNAPEISVELDIGGERVSVRKRFLENPACEVHMHGDGMVLRGAAAEEMLLARLDGRAPGKTGSKREDMGLWGLLWVGQDETAYADPGKALDDNTRGALSDVIGRQVGQVLGGRHGELLHTQVHERVGRYFDLRNWARKGEYAVATERLAAASARVKKLEEAKADVRSLESEHQTLSEQLREAEDKLPALQREHDEAVAADQRVRALEADLREAEARVAAASARVLVVEQEVETRAALVREAHKLEAEIKKSDEATSELTRTFEQAKTAAAVAREAAAQARAEALGARAAFDAATEDLEGSRQRDEASRAGEDLRAAEQVAEDLAGAARRLEAEAIDERALEQMESLAAKATAIRGRLDAEGTRIIVIPAEGGAIVRAVGGPATIDVPGIGVLEVEPARPGLAQALTDAERRRAKLEEAILALGVADVSEARARHATRVEIEREEEAIGAQMKRLAPKGLDALEQKVKASQAERARLEAALGEAVRADREREESARSLADRRLDEAAMDMIRQREQDVAVLRAACDAIGTRVEVIALAALRVRAGASGAPQTLGAGERVAFTSTLGTSVILDEIAEIKLDPRGADLAKSRAKLDRAERDLAEALEAVGVASSASAAEAARAWALLDATRRQAEARLAEVAPRGLEALRAGAEKARAESVTAEAALSEARRASSRHAQIEVEISQNRVTRDALARIEKLEREVVDAEAAVRRLCARVRGVSGPVAAGARREWTVTRPMRPDAVDGIAWEIIPGEIGGGLDVEGLERRLREALDRAGVADLEAAKARFRIWVALDAKVAELCKHLKSLAPDGLDALRARAAALGRAGAAHTATEGGTAKVDLAALRVAVDQRREQARALATTADRAAEILDGAEREIRVLESSLGEAAAVRHEKAARLDVVSERLTAERDREPDLILWRRRDKARWDHDQALASARMAADELEAASPRLLRGEVIRAQGAIESHRKSVADLRENVLRRKVLLDKAAVEGHAEELGKAESEQGEADAALARIEQDAKAARLLAKVVEEAYAESQRLFLGPVIKEAEPYLAKLRPGTAIRMTRDLKLDKVVRRGEEEDFGELSGGTREQLSVIVRLTLARVLARDKRPLPLILDDTLGWTDDARFLSMVQILRDAASELQIILLTCHPARFTRFQAGYSVDLDELRRGPLLEALGGQRAQ